MKRARRRPARRRDAARRGRHRRAGRRSARRRRLVVGAADRRAHDDARARRDRPAQPGAGRVLLPGAELGGVPRRVPVRRPRRPARLPATPAARPSSSPLLKVPAADPDERIGSLVVNPGGPGAPGTDYAASAAGGVPRADPRRLRHRRLRPARHRRQRPGRLPHRRRARRLHRRRPRPGHRRRGRRSSPAGSSELGAAAPSAPATWPPTSPRSRPRATWTCCGPRSASRRSTYFGASYGTKLGATYADLFPDRVGRLVLDGAVDVSISSRELSLEQAAGFETALRAYVENCVDEADDCFLGDSVDDGLARIKELPRRRRRAAAGDRRRPAARGRQRLLRRRAAALQPRLLADPRPGAAGRLRRRRLGAAAALRPLQLARPERLHRQQLRGDLRDQLPRRPVRDPAGGGARRTSPTSRRPRRPSARSSPGA